MLEVGFGPGGGVRLLAGKVSSGQVAGIDSGFASAERDGYSASWREGKARYGSDADYRRGWDASVTACYHDELRHPRTIGGQGGR